MADPRGGGTLFGAGADETAYHTTSYEVLRYTLTDVMALGESIAPDATNMCLVGGVQMLPDNCPKADPVHFLDVNRSGLGVPVYEEDDPLNTQAPRSMTSGGYKTWIVSASSACGRMMAEQAQPALFPNGIGDYEYLFNVALGRHPAEAEVAILDALKAREKVVGNPPAYVPAFPTDAMKGSAVCTAVLGTLEFLMAN